MMRRALLMLLVLLLLLTALPVLAEETPLYRARTLGAASISETPGGTRLTTLKENTWITISEVGPTFVKATVNGLTGYVYRSRIEQVTPIDPASTPPYGVEVFQFTAVTSTDVPVLSEKNAEAKVLLTLHPGAKLSLIGVEEGYGKVIYHRQYAYVDTRLLKELQMVRTAPAESLPAPIATYTSYYKIVETEANIGRMKNIAVACAKLCEITLQPGDSLDFNKQIGPYSKANGYFVAPVLADGKTKLNYGGGTCQVSSTLYNVVLQLPGLTVLKRRAHGPSGASYLPHGVDAAVGNTSLNFVFKNDYDFPVRIQASAQDGALYMSIWRED